jgi:hypothetical protein
MNLHGGQEVAVKNHAQRTQSCYSQLEEQFNAGKDLLDGLLAQIRTSSAGTRYQESVAKNEFQPHKG